MSTTSVGRKVVPPRNLRDVISVFTPTHDPRYLDDAYRSLLRQTNPDWEWIVVLNNQAQHWEADDPRVHVKHAGAVKGVGMAKAIACEMCSGDIMVELDHDDVLAADALEHVQAAFDANPGIGFVYSHFAQVSADLATSETPFGAAYGWTYRDVPFDDRIVTQTNVLGPTPHNCAHIWYGPNHVRAWRSTVYHKVGGYNRALTVLDDQDLMCRMFIETDFHLIDRCLYLQRNHGGNTQLVPAVNQQIQQDTLTLVDANLRAMSLAWTARRGLPLLSLTRADAPTVMSTLAAIPTSSVGVVEAIDFLQHVAGSVALMNELHRVLVPSGMLLSATPSTDGRGAFQDPSHQAFFNENSFWYYTDERFAGLVPQIQARFQASRLDTYFPSGWHEANQIPYVRANLIAFKDGPRNGGALNW